jgi:hypothetical protein
VSGNVLYTASGFNAVSLISGVNIVKVSGESVVVRSGLIEIASGRVSVSGSVIVTSVSGNVVIAQTSGDTVRLVSGHNTVAIQAFDLSGLAWNNLAVDTSGGSALKITGNLSASTDVSGQIIRSILSVSGNPPTPLASITTTSGAALLTMQATKSVFKSYITLQITNLSGGTQLLSGQSTVVSIRNLGISGTYMFVGSSGTGNLPWAQAEQSGLGWYLGPKDAVTIPIPNPDLLFVAVAPASRSGQRISYMISADL